MSARIKIKLGYNAMGTEERAYQILQMTGAIYLQFLGSITRYRVGDYLSESKAEQLTSEESIYEVTTTPLQ